MYNQSKVWFEIQVNAKNVKNVSLLPPYSGLSQMKITIPPGQSAAIIGIRLSNKATNFSFGTQETLIGSGASCPSSFCK